METIFVILIIVFLIVYFLAQDSKKSTKKERYGEAIGNLASMAADSVAGAAFKITESSDSKKKRLAEEALAERNGNIYRIRTWDSNAESSLKRYMTVDDNFKYQLELLGLSVERWKKLALTIYAMGIIIQSSRDSMDYSKKYDARMREYLYSEDNEYGTEMREKPLEVLDYLKIPMDEWMKYGETVLDMHNIYDSPDMQKYGYKTKLMPMKNNFHLL